jgi:hypothetical protein
MNKRLVFAWLATILFYVIASAPAAAAGKALDVLNMTEIPAGTYDVQLEDGGKSETVKLNIKGGKARFIRSTSTKFEGLSGSFELIGNGVFVAHLSSRSGNATQIWLFRPDGTAKVKESPDRGEKQMARLSAQQ